MLFIKHMDTWRVRTLMHSRSGYLSPGCKGQLLVGGSLGTVDKGERNDSREKGDERGPSACPAAVQQQPDGTREKSWASQNPAQCLTHQECACTCPWMNVGCRRGVLKLNLNCKWLNFTQWSHFFFLCFSPQLSPSFCSFGLGQCTPNFVWGLASQLWLTIGVADHIRVSECVFH